MSKRSRMGRHTSRKVFRRASEKMHVKNFMFQSRGGVRA